MKRPPNPATTNLDVGVLSNNEDDVDTAVASTNLDTGILSKNSNTGRVRPVGSTTKETNKRKSSVPVTAIKKKGGHNNIVKPRPEKRHFTGTNSKKPTIGGGLYSPITNSAKAAECPVDVGYVQCFNGYEVYDNGDYTGDTCAEACGGECCVGDFTNPDTGVTTNACDGFSGRVCKDGNSCIGEQACFRAYIRSVISGCKGDGACFYASYDSPTYIEKVHSSCNGFRACDGAADYGGFIDYIVDSCQGDYACTYLANEYGSVSKVRYSCIEDNSCFAAALFGGTINEIVFSCDGEYSCAYAAFGRYYDNVGAYGGGRIGGIEDSCYGFKSCMYAAELGGSIGYITFFSCSGDYSCYALTYNYGTVGNIYDSCQKDSSCLNAAAGSGYIGYIFAGCDGLLSCNEAASSQGRIDGIFEGCNEYKACEGAAFGGFTISPAINDCCNEAFQCLLAESFDDTNCDDDPTPPPTGKPTTSPTRSSPTTSPTIDVSLLYR